MRLLGFEISRVEKSALNSVPDSGRGWYPLVRESFTGAWQRGWLSTASRSCPTTPRSRA
jgi:hypothetical protein